MPNFNHITTHVMNILWENKNVSSSGSVWKSYKFSLTFVCCITQRSWILEPELLFLRVKVPSRKWIMDTQNASYQAGQVKGQTQVASYPSYFYINWNSTFHAFIIMCYFCFGLGKGKQHDRQGEQCCPIYQGILPRGSTKFFTFYYKFTITNEHNKMLLISSIRKNVFISN